MADTDHLEKIKEIMKNMKCPKHFECCRLGDEDTCQAKDIGLESLVECTRKDPVGCDYSLSFGYSWFCQCPLQLYVAKEMNSRFPVDIL